MARQILTPFDPDKKTAVLGQKPDRNTENMFSISFRKHRDEVKENSLLTLIIKMYIFFARAIIASTACAI